MTSSTVLCQFHIGCNKDSDIHHINCTVLSYFVIERHVDGNKFMLAGVQVVSAHSASWTCWVEVVDLCNIAKNIAKRGSYIAPDIALSSGILYAMGCSGNVDSQCRVDLLCFVHLCDI